MSHQPSKPARRDLLLRLTAALFAGYAAASGIAIGLAVLLPGGKAEAVLAGTLLSFALYAAAVIWAFAARSAGRAWCGLLLAGAIGFAPHLLLHVR
jgi:hypothetical protein